MFPTITATPHARNVGFLADRPSLPPHAIDQNPNAHEHASQPEREHGTTPENPARKMPTGALGGNAGGS
jgi:hypothetical protein